MPEAPRSSLLMPVHSAKPAGAQLVALGQAQALSRHYDLVIAVGHGDLRPRFAPLGELVARADASPRVGRLAGAGPSK